MDPSSPGPSDKPPISPRRHNLLKLRLQKVLSGKQSASSYPTSPVKFTFDRNSMEATAMKRSSSAGDAEIHPKKDVFAQNTKKKIIETMTSPAIKAANQPKENGKSETSSQSNVTIEAEQQRATPPLTAWWRVFKLANLLMQQGC